LALAGLIEIVNGCNVIVAEAVFVASAAFVAITVTVRCVGITVGVEYSPEELTVPPSLGVTLQVTMPPPETVAVNC
jgi:hypothetical protein